MTEQEEQKILSYFKKYNINLEDKPEFKTNKEMILKVAQQVIRLLEHAGDDLMKKPGIVQGMFEQQLQERINKQT